MTLALTALAAATLLVHLLTVAELARAWRHLVFLEDVEPAASGPMVSVIVPARDEAETIAAALSTVLGQGYGPLEVIVVDDRSSDGTGAIAGGLAAAHERLRTVTVESLPAGWLGKNHALWRGAREARGELLLFTDADVHMAPDTVARAVAHLRARGLDHLTVAPAVLASGFLLEACVAVFGLFFALFLRPWKARDPGAEAFVGIGAFNLVARPAYEAAGTHRAIALRPDDDIKLGKIVRAAGGAQDLAVGRGLVEVEWYPDVGALVRGLMKNSFAAMEYRVSAVVAGTTAMLVLYALPFAGLLAPGPARWLWLASAALLLAIHAAGARAVGLDPRTAVLFPLVVVILAWIQWRAMLLTLWTGGIEWRGTRYSLDELRKNRV